MAETWLQFSLVLSLSVIGVAYVTCRTTTADATAAVTLGGFVGYLVMRAVPDIAPDADSAAPLNAIFTVILLGIGIAIAAALRRRLNP
ncbi:hypothetical protein GKE82_26200 [Conexibacter sp. W3-3-2]|uniref:hypothetical protein n=1 Tax=Conexibacter sp. W3-3-2 TaxID=2675227 RepID=UPI0012B77998|nr:hypothetical protein [Conexibacter sp. W3-3-2]MTD47613.1 hypothetical protein [Conexibacter sp. W3-3-2]MTD47698.1 hypothetical protein [Conexibacter sp. W3-3-2]